MRKGNFTLIELLVVIAIILILMSILLPALKSAKELAKRSVCQGQQKQIGLALSGYCFDNDSWLVPSMKSTWQGQTMGGDSSPVRLKILVTTGYIPASGVKVNDVSLAKSKELSQILYCPGFAYQSHPYSSNPHSYWINRYCGYSYNVPMSAGSSNNYFIWKVPNNLNHKPKGRRGNCTGTVITSWDNLLSQEGALKAINACFDRGSTVPSKDRPHRARGCVVLYLDGSVSFMKRPSGTWTIADHNIYDWYSSLNFWKSARDNY